MTRARRHLALVLGVWMAGGGCVYYNGIYNAQAEARQGDARLARDDEGGATTRYQRSAAIAESVLVRHPASKWRPRALFLAARNGAMAAQCDRAMPRLLELLGGTTLSAADRDAARLALAACEVRTGCGATARPRLDSLVGSDRPELARQSRIWGARAALSMGDRDAVPAYLGGLGASVLQWELIAASLSAREYARVESLLVARARIGDYREDVARALRELVSDGRFSGAERIVGQYDAAGIGDESRARLHFTLGDVNLRLGRDSLARRHLYSARILSRRDTVTAREAEARLALLELSTVASIGALDTLVARQDSVVWGTAYAAVVAERLLLFRLLASRSAADDPGAASSFLAAEIARDSLRAPRLARILFVEIARERPASLLGPQAWYAAALLEPDSADAWHRRILADYPQSAVAARLRGQEPSDRADFVRASELLRLQWSETLRRWTDSVRTLRLPPKSSAR